MKIDHKGISVVIPVRGKVGLLARALNSCYVQTLLPSEIIVINDSVNKSEENLVKTVAQNFAQKLEVTQETTKLIYLNSQGSGASAARNLGVKAARGAYIAFLDADDYFLPDKLELQLNAMIESKSDISHTNYFATSNGYKSRIIVTSINQGFNQDKFISFRECRIATPTVMIRKDILTNQFNIFPDNASIIAGEDLIAWARICQLSSKPLLHLPQTLSVVEVNSESSSASVEKIKIAKLYLSQYADIHGIKRPSFYQYGGIKRLLIQSLPLNMKLKDFIKKQISH